MLGSYHESWFPLLSSSLVSAKSWIWRADVPMMSPQSTATTLKTPHHETIFRQSDGDRQTTPFHDGGPTPNDVLLYHVGKRHRGHVHRLWPVASTVSCTVCFSSSFFCFVCFDESGSLSWFFLCTSSSLCRTNCPWPSQFVKAVALVVQAINKLCTR